MKQQRLTITATLLALAVLGAAPTVASAGPLLSGYGGPGQGNQAILGSAVVNGGSGGGHSGSGGSTGAGGHSSTGSSSAGVDAAGAGTAAPSAGTAPRAATGASAGAKGGAPAAASHNGRKQANRQLAGSSGTGSAASAGFSTSSASRGGAGGGQTLGLSGADLLYILLAFGALVFTGVITRRLAREPGGPGRDTAKAMPRNTRVSS